MNTPGFMRTMRVREHDAMAVLEVVYENPLRFFSQSPKFKFEPPLPVREAPKTARPAKTSGTRAGN